MHTDEEAKDLSMQLPTQTHIVLYTGYKHHHKTRCIEIEGKEERTTNGRRLPFYKKKTLWKNGRQNEENTHTHSVVRFLYISFALFSKIRTKTWKRRLVRGGENGRR